MKFLDSLSFRTQILLGFLVVALIPMLIALVSVNQVYRYSFQREMQKEGEQQVTEIADKFQKFLVASQEMDRALCEDDLSANALIDKVNDKYLKELYTMLYHESTSIPSDAVINIYDAGGYFRFSTKIEGKEDNLPVYWGILAEAKKDRNKLFHVSDNVAGAESDMLMQTAYTVLNHAGVRMGYITTGINENAFKALFGGNLNSNDVLYVTDAHLNLIYSTEKGADRETIEQLLNQKGGKNDWYTWKQDDETGYYMILKKSTLLTEATQQQMFRISLGMSFVSLILCVIFAVIIGRQLSWPINQLNKAMNLVKKGNLTIHVHTKQKNELGELTNNFNHMTEELDKHVKNMVQRQKDIKDMQIKLFQTQLNPHFLYNTLDSIKWTAKLHKLEDIALMAENLAYILQSSIRSEQFITLQRELEIVANYMQIQQVRFGGKFHYEVEIPDFLENCIVPKLMLQPIVENSIIHGLADKEEGSISIYADQVGDTIHISVTDDGRGISQELIEWLQTENFTENTGHLGLYNVNKIIKLYFGTEYGITAAYEEGIGTTITIVLPIRKEADP